jgi:hypothetical protein
MLAGAQLSGLDRVRSSSNLRSHITETTFVHCTPEAAADGLEKNLPCCSLKKMRIDPREKASRRHVMDDATRCRLLLLFFMYHTAVHRIEFSMAARLPSSADKKRVYMDECESSGQITLALRKPI